MDWSYILKEVLTTFIKFGVIISAFYLSKVCVSVVSKDDKKKLDWFDKLGIIISVYIVIPFLIAALWIHFTSVRFIINLLIVLIPSTIGMYFGFRRNSLKHSDFINRKFRKGDIVYITTDENKRLLIVDKYQPNELASSLRLISDDPTDIPETELVNCYISKGKKKFYVQLPESELTKSS